MLSSDLITTKMIQDKYVIDEETNKMVLEDQWTSLTYLRKSLKDQDKEEIDNKGATIESGYYEYSINVPLFVSSVVRSNVIVYSGACLLPPCWRQVRSSDRSLSDVQHYIMSRNHL